MKKHLVRVFAGVRSKKRYSLDSNTAPADDGTSGVNPRDYKSHSTPAVKLSNFADDDEKWVKEQRRLSKHIDKDIQKWMKEFKSAIKILLLGAGESGKTTILKQMRILHIEGFTRQERKEKIKEIRSNVLEAMQDLLEYMNSQKMNFRNSELEESAEYIAALESVDQEDKSKEFYEHVKTLWQSDEIQKCHEMCHKLSLLDSSKYFLDKLEDISAEDFIPSDQDILFSRRRTTEVQRLEFDFKVPKHYGGGTQQFWMFDVGGQRGQRKKWIQVFDGISAVLFVVACNSYNMHIREDVNVNGLRESLSLFDDVWNSRFLKDAGFVMFLNKQDLLREKIANGISIGEHFPEYADYRLDNRDIDPNEDLEYVRTRCFIRDKFKKVVRTKRHDQYTIPHYEERNRYRECFWHYTTATNTSHVKQVFEDVNLMVITWNLQAVLPL